MLITSVCLSSEGDPEPGQPKNKLNNDRSGLSLHTRM